MPLYDNEVRAVLTTAADPAKENSITIEAPDSKPNTLPPDPGGAAAPLVLVDGWYGYTDSERITYTGRTDNGNGTYTLTGVTWAQEGTSSPATWPAGTFAVQDIPASWYEEREQADSGPVTASDIDSEQAAAAEVIKADGNGAASWGPVGWTEITNKPSTFPPSAHTHEVDALAATGITDGHVPVAQGDGTIAWEAQSGGGGGSTTLSINNQTGASYTLASGDEFVRMNHADRNTVYLPLDTNASIQVGKLIRVRQIGAGVTTIKPESGVAINRQQKAYSPFVGAESEVIKVAADEYDVSGDIQVLDAYASRVEGLSPIAYWRLDEVSGTTARDETANGHDGTYNNGYALAANPLITTGNAVEFDGASGSGVTGPDIGLTTNDSVTLVAWFKTSTRAQQRIIALGNSASDGPQFFMRIDSDGTLQVFARGTESGENTSVNSTSVVDDGSAHMAAAVIDGANGGIELFLDGASVGTASNGSAFTLANLDRSFLARWVTISGSSNVQELNGTVDEAVIFNSLLTATDVSNLYSDGTA